MLINEAPGGCDLSARDGHGSTPLMLAAGRGLLEVVKTLVAKGVEVNVLDDDGWTALACAVDAKQEECALYLLEEASASWRGNIRDACGMKSSSVLGLAIMTRIPRVVKALVQRMRADGVALARCITRTVRANPSAGYHWRHWRHWWRRAWT